MKALTTASGPVGKRGAKSPAPSVAATAASTVAVAIARSGSPSNASMEVRAERAAERFLRGDGGLVGDVGRTAAAAPIPVPGSAGRALPDALRRTLEHGFSADLSAVRLHQDEAARAAVRRSGARGFAAGADVYLGITPSGLSARSGLQLLAHEVAHVLQQTARRGADGRLWARRVHGAAAPQFASDEFVNLMDNYKLFRGVTAWEDIKAAYAGVSDAQLHIDAIETELVPYGPISEEATGRLAAMVDQAAFAGFSDDQKGLYVDALKLVGGDVAFEAARGVLIKYRKVRTAYRSRRFYEYVRKVSLGWLYGYAVSDDFAKDYYPGRFISAYRRFFVSPGAAPIDREPSAGEADSKVFRDRLLAVLGVARRAVPGTLMDNELRASMLLAFYYLDEGRRSHLPKEVAANRDPGESLIKVHATIARLYATNDYRKSSPTGSVEATALFGAVFSAIQEQATRAATYWDRIEKFRHAFESASGLNALNAEQVKAVALGVRDAPRFSRLADVLRKVASVVFARAGGNLPAPGTFAPRVEQQRAALLGEMARHTASLAEHLRKASDNSDEAIQIGLALQVLGEVEAQLARYDPARDQTLSKKKQADERIAARLRLARALLTIGKLFQWNDVRDAGNDVFLEGQQLALLSGWELDPTPVEVGDLGGQVGQITSWRGTRITGPLLDRYLYIDYYNKLTARLRELLRNGASEDKPILNEAMGDARASKALPRRFIVRDWEWGSPDSTGVASVTVEVVGSAPAPKEKSFSELVFDKVATRELVERERSQRPNDLALAPDSPFSTAAPLFLWFVPDFDAFIRMVAQIDVVRAAVDRNWIETHEDGLAPPDPEQAPFDWLHALEALVRVLNSAATEEDVQRPGDTADVIKDRVEKENARRKRLLDLLGGAIAGEVKSEFERAEGAAKRAAREAVSHQRRVTVDTVLRPMLNQYDRFDNAHWSVPDRVFAAVRNFADFVWPDEDTALQTAALAIELAPELMAAFGPHDGLFGVAHERRHDIIDTVLGLSWGALKVWDAGHASAAAAAAGTAPVVNPIAAISPLTQSALSANADILRALRDSLATNATKEQRRHGLRMVKGAQGEGSMRSVYWDEEGMSLIKHFAPKHGEGETFVIPVGHGFDLYGITYMLVEVHESFTFHPRFARGESLGVDWPAGKRPGDAQLRDANGDPIEPTGRTLFTLFRKPKIGDAQTVVVKDTDVQNLTVFTRVLGDRFAFDYIAGAGGLIEAHANLIMDVLEFLPGVGQGVAAARFIAGILQTIASPEFADLLDAFSEDGVGAFEKIFASFAHVVHPELLANVLIFDADFKEEVRGNAALRGKDDRQKKISGKGGPWTRIAVMLKNVVNIGRRVLDQIKRLSKRVQVPVRDTQLWVLRTPAAGLILELVEKGFDVIESLSVESLAQTAEDMVDKGWQVMVQEAATGAAQGVADRGRNIMDTLRQLELPEEVIPMELVIDFIIDLVVHALSAKYRKGVEAVRAVLRGLGLWDTVLKAVKDGLYVAGVDPNELYRKHAREKLQPWLAEVRDEFSGELAATFDKVPFLATINKPVGTPVQLDFSGLGFPEAEGYGLAANAARGTTDSPTVPAALGSGGGERLPARARRRAESAFGHDLAHVRVHRDAEAARVTAASGAHALTSGSHVYLRAGLDCHAGEGQHILNHELAHVVQQTGPRPLGRHAADMPVRGRPGLGLRFSAPREADADRAARAVGDQQVASRPMALAGAPGNADGLQPQFTNKFLKTFLRRLHDPQDIDDAVQELRGKKPKAVTLGAQSKAVADALAPALKTWIDKAAIYKAPFSTVHGELKTFVDSVWSDFAAMIPELVDRAETTMSAPKPSGQTQAAVTYLPPADLAVQLERTLYGLTSMAFVVELNATKGPANVKGRDIVDKAKPVKKVSMVYVHLPLLEATPDAEKLWDLLTKNTFGKDADYSAATHGSFKEAMKLVLGRGSPDPGNYLASAFKLGSLRATRVRNQRARMVEFAKAANEWPTPTQYAEPDAGAVSGAVQNIGLRVGTFSTWKNAGVEDRDAHHAVQYLLFEYLNNDKSGKQPFPKLSAVGYPGVSGSGGTVNTIGAGTGGIDVARFFPGRGGQMPTIYLARHTHQSDIHYRSETPDDMPGGRSSQGAHIHNTFKDKMGPYKAVLEDEPALRQLAIKHKAGDDDVAINTNTPAITVNAVGKAIYSAARATYKDMWGEMKPKLREALDGPEVEYYNAIARQRGSALIGKTQMDKPFAKIVEDTEKVVGTTFGG